mgnify:CR=1 FL=1
MPELPEVETVKETLKQKLINTAKNDFLQKIIRKIYVNCLLTNLRRGGIMENSARHVRPRAANFITLFYFCQYFFYSSK